MREKRDQKRERARKVENLCSFGQEKRENTVKVKLWMKLIETVVVMEMIGDQGLHTELKASES